MNRSVTEETARIVLKRVVSKTNISRQSDLAALLSNIHGHEYCGTVVEIGSEVETVESGEFVVGSFCLSDKSCPHCRYGFQSSCEHRQFMTGCTGTISANKGRDARQQRAFMAAEESSLAAARKQTLPATGLDDLIAPIADVRSLCGE